jgi:hypothetical protein
MIIRANKLFNLNFEKVKGSNPAYSRGYYWELKPDCAEWLTRYGITYSFDSFNNSGYYTMVKIQFKDKNDEMLFKLTWL